MDWLKGEWNDPEWIRKLKWIGGKIAGIFKQNLKMGVRISR